MIEKQPRNHNLFWSAVAIGAIALIGLEILEHHDC